MDTAGVWHDLIYIHIFLSLFGNCEEICNEQKWNRDIEDYCSRPEEGSWCLG